MTGDRPARGSRGARGSRPGASGPSQMPSATPDRVRPVETTSDTEPSICDPARLSRLRWRARRGMLENDLVLARYLDARGSAITEAEVAMLDILLDLPDNDLWDLIAGRAEPVDPAVSPLVAALRRH